ncbi:hypothetical protein K437DRAFT_219544 [Tilletiaria anomala UBC 951]|uniref:C4-dicarboxylate transporter/malic acid transport protein n=1 Tax=Tilletiaria anomala (strain ATCC 24038 / CBS 436.72 / UBC 951) TaxID=1037660 RepID=A0A066WGD7_TILAU|nr:uncharacterized protein K437DRAFT_219544 [Tilletiaria anomala UBC 951]KDN53047.1 hypothetical protein K437DRAFT_219544 [Tilletiaria anomala UBC 951]
MADRERALLSPIPSQSPLEQCGQGDKGILPFEGKHVSIIRDGALTGAVDQTALTGSATSQSAESSSKVSGSTGVEGSRRRTRASKPGAHDIEKGQVGGSNGDEGGVADDASKQNAAGDDITGGAHLSDEEKLGRCKTGLSVSSNQKDTAPPRRDIRDRVLHFTPSWFSVTMGTGVLATLFLLLGQVWPSLLVGLRYPAIVWIVADVIIFILFAAMFSARYIIWPQVLPLTVKHPQKSMFLGTPVMGLVTIISGIAQLGTREFHLGLSWTVVMTGFWWLTVALSLLTSVGIPWSMMTYQDHYFEGTTAALLLPIVPPITVAAVGSTLCDLLIEYGGEPYYAYSWTIMCTSYLVLGVGLPLALAVLVLYFQRLLLFNSPPRETIISCMLPLGPCGQGGEAVLHLGQVAMKLFPYISRPVERTGIPQLFDVGQAMYAAGLIGALFLWALGIWWLMIAMLTILRERKEGRLPFNMGWWSMTFPVASMAICTARLALTLDSLALKITYTGFVFANVIFWAAVAVPTAKGFWTGELLQAPCIASLPLQR